MPPESNSDTATGESVAVQVIEENQELVKKYALGDLSVLGTLQDKALKLAAGRLNAQSVKETLLRKLGAGI